MNMTSVLHRTNRFNVTDTRSRATPDTAPPTLPPTPRTPGDERPWPARVKAVVAILIVAAASAAMAYTSGNDDSAERELREQIATLVEERNQALDNVESIDADLAAARQQLEAAQTGNDDLNERADQLDAQIVTLTEQRAEVLASVDDLEAQVSDLEADVVSLNADLGGANALVTAATAAHDALAKLFPMTFDASLVGVPMVGSYDVVLSQVYCSGLATCGKAPALADATIRSTPEGFLRLNIPNFVEGGLSRAGGALHLIAGSTSAVPPCANTARSAVVTMTLFPSGYRITQDGIRTVTDMGTVVTVHAPAVGDCPAVVASYGAELAAKV